MSVRITLHTLNDKGQVLVRNAVEEWRIETEETVNEIRDFAKQVYEAALPDYPKGLVFHVHISE